MNGAGYWDVALLDGEVERRVRVVWERGEMVLSSEGAQGRVQGGVLLLGGLQVPTRVVRDGGRMVAIVEGESWALRVVDRLAAPEAAAVGAGRVVAPMPGRIVSVSVAAGEAVELGAVLLVLEAMKVQMRIAAPRAGVVAAVHVAVGALVEEGMELVGFVAEAGGRIDRGIVIGMAVGGTVFTRSCSKVIRTSSIGG